MSSKSRFINLVESKFGKNHILSVKDIHELLNSTPGCDIPWPQWLTKSEYRVHRGVYRVPDELEVHGIHGTYGVAAPAIQNIIPNKNQQNNSYIPEKDPNFEKFGFYSDLKNIIKSKKFYPIFISGPSGIGKTFLVEQVCAELKKECIRVNFSIETDQTDLIGGPTLVNGNITYSEGPVITCLRNGYILLLDEVDRSNPNNILILNGILEGRGFYNPKTGEYIKAAEGFNVIMTANSKGFGDESGKYLSQILDSAFLERLPVTFESEFPNEKTESKILSHHLDDEDFIQKLVKWARVIRKTFNDGGIDEIISTRRLVHIAQAYSMFNCDKLKAISLCVSRFESHTKEAFIDLYTKIDAGVNLDEDDVDSNITDDVGF